MAIFMKVRTVVFDFPSLMGLILNYKTIRKAENIILFNGDERILVKYGFNIIKYLIWLIGKKNVQEIQVEPYRFWCMNPEVVDFIEKNDININKRLVESMCKLANASKEDVKKFIKKLQIRPVAKKLYIRKQLEQARQNQSCLIITDDNIYGVYNNFNNIFEDKWAFKSLITFFMTLSATLMAHWIVFSKFNLSLKRNLAEPKDLLVQVNIFGYENDTRKEYRPEHYVYDKEKVSMLIVDAWLPFSPHGVKKYQNHLKKLGISYLYYKDFSVLPHEIIHSIAIYLKSLISISRIFRSWGEFQAYFEFLVYLIHETQYARHYNCKAILCHDDYAARHIVRTFICRKMDMLTIGTQHSSGNGLYSATTLAYVCMDKYLIWGNFYRELFNRYWNDLSIVEYGYSRIDSFLKRLEKDETLDTAKLFIPTSSKKNILITLPRIANFESFLEMLPNGIEMINFLHSIDESILSFANIYIRPKDPKTMIEKIINNPSLKVIYDSSCTTNELACLSDLVISSNGSGVITECSLLRKKVITFDYLGCLKDIWLKYGNQMCLTNAKEIRGTVVDFINDRKIDVNWEYLWEDIVYKKDDGSNSLLRNIVEA
jgi:hypothetical protein